MRQRRWWPDRIRSAALAAASCLLPFAPAGAAGEACAPATFAGAFEGEVTLCQNWNTAEQQEFWFLSQGSQIIPYAWFLALEQPGGEALFRDSAHMDRFRYLPQRPTERNPDGLPVGFTRDGAQGNRAYAAISPSWLGMTCAACHTNRIEFGGRKMLIDGAPAMADFEGLMLALAGALRATLDNGPKFDRFAARVLGPGGATPAAKTTLRQQLATMTAAREAWNRRNAGQHAYGFARLDAIGAIFNEVAASALGVPGNAKPADAPVSYPFLWDTPHHDRVQWNGSVENAGPGALGRNVGEVLGVFGSIALNTSIVKKDGHENSVNIPHLGRLEGLLTRLQSPQWPGGTILPAVDAAKDPFGKGREAFERFCEECHADIDRADPARRVEAVMTPLDGGLGTDPGMAANFANRTYESGRLRNRSKRYLVNPIDIQLFDRTGSGVEFLGNAVIGTIVHELIRHPSSTLRAINAGRSANAAAVVRAAADPEDTLMRVAGGLRMDEPAEDAAVGGLAYKARPLNGIWATAPYLHNGSVRTLRQLLLPAARRQATFRVGSREYDPAEVGFADAGGYLLDTRLPGDSNAGHEYGTDVLSAEPDTLDALLEYLKTL